MWDNRGADRVREISAEEAYRFMRRGKEYELIHKYFPERFREA
jgi:hypothetical protein